MANRKYGTSIKGYRELIEENQRKLEKYKDVEVPVLENRVYTPDDFYYEGPTQSKLLQQTKGEDYIGNSIWDPESFTAEEAFGDNRGIENARGENQWGIVQLGNGITKGVILAGTTFLEGTVGLITGIASAVTGGSFWDNAFNRAMQSVNDWSEKALPNYYTNEELNSPWYTNILSANFIGDKFLKNLGFTVGAFYSGGIASMALEALRIPKLINLLTRSTGMAKHVTSLLGAGISAINEGSIEALNNSRDFYNYNKALVDDKYADELANAKIRYEETGDYESYQRELATINSAYKNKLNELEENRINMGNMDFLMNIPILTASNVLQFGRLYANGFKTGRRNLNIYKRYLNEADDVAGKTVAKTAGKETAEVAGKESFEYASEKATKLGKTWSVLKSPISEGNEELLQKAASEVAGTYYSTDPNSFYESGKDKTSERTMNDFIEANIKGFAKTYGDINSWEEFFIGAITGALGMPKFRSMRDSEGKLRSPITLEGGSVGEYREYMKNMNRQQAVTDYLNNRKNSKEFQNYWRGLSRHLAMQRAMDEAILKGDKFEFDNAEFQQMVSDIAMFDFAGKLDDLKGMIEEAVEPTDENIDTIIEFTKNQLNNGKTIGAFTDANNNAYINSDGSVKNRDEVAKRLQQSKQELFDTIELYKKTAFKLDQEYGEQFTDDQLTELTWMKAQIENWKKRSADLADNHIGKTIDILDKNFRINNAIRNTRGQQVAAIQEDPLYMAADKNANLYEDTIKLFEQVKVFKGEDLVKVLTHPKNKHIVDLLKNIIESDTERFSEEEKKQALIDINDLQRLVDAQKTFENKIKEYLKNPESLEKAHEEADKKREDKEFKQKSKGLKDSLSKAENIKEFRDILSQEEDDNIKDKTIEELEAEGNKIATQHREFKEYRDAVELELSKQGDKEAVNDAIALFNEHELNSDTLEDLANTTSVHLDNEHAFDESSNNDIELSTKRFAKANAVIKAAMEAVNSIKKYKDRFKRRYEEPSNKKDEDNNGETIEEFPISYFTRNRVKVSGKYVKKTDSKGNSIVTYEGDPKAQIVIDGKDLGLSDKDLIGSKKDRKTADEIDFYERLVLALKNQRLRIVSAKKTANGEYEIVTNEGGFTIKGEAAKKIFEKYFTKRGQDKSNNDEDYPYGDEYPFEHGVGNITVDELDKETDEIANSTADRKKADKKYYRPAVPEFGIDESRDRDFRDFSEVRPSFKEIYEYLKKNGAFDYVNKGNLHPGDEIFFMIDPEFDETVKDKDWHTEPVIFMVVKNEDKYQIVGSLDSGKSVDNFIGLRALRDKVIQEYNVSKTTYNEQHYDGESTISATTDKDGVTTYEFNQYRKSKKTGKVKKVTGGGIEVKSEIFILKPEQGGFDEFLSTTSSKIIVKKIRTDGKRYFADISVVGDSHYESVEIKPEYAQQLIKETKKESKQFVASPKTKVSKIMIGKVPYGTEEKSLRTINGISENTKNQLFAIIRNGTFVTNGEVSADQIVGIESMAKREGRLYLLIPNGAGKYSPVAVRVKHFNAKEFNIYDATIGNNKENIVGDNIKSAIVALAQSKSKSEMVEAIKSLQGRLFLRDIRINWVTEGGVGLVIGKVAKDKDGRIKTDKNGHQIYEDKDYIYFTEYPKKITNADGLTLVVSNPSKLDDEHKKIFYAQSVTKSEEEIIKEITDKLMSFNLPLQVSIKGINKGGYNKTIIDSDVTTANISEAAVKDCWFTTDYFDNNLELQEAENPPSKYKTLKPITPVGGSNSVIPGTKVVGAKDGKTYYVDINERIIRDEDGNEVATTKDNKILFDLAWAENIYGNNTTGVNMLDNKCILPDGKRGIDRTEQRYLTEEELKELKDSLKERLPNEPLKGVKVAQEIIEQILEVQELVDRESTNKNYYKILEEDGKYHEYDRVHPRIGSNYKSNISAEDQKVLDDIEAKLNEFIEKKDLIDYQTYLKNLAEIHKVNLDLYTELNNRNVSAVVNTVRDKILGINSQRSLEAGTSVDTVVRDFFALAKEINSDNVNDYINQLHRPSNLSKVAFNQLCIALVDLKKTFDTLGETVYANNLVIFKKYADGTRIAGELDILTVNKKGEFKIYDIKTALNVSNMDKKSSFQTMSNKEYYSLQLSAYSNLLEAKYGVKATNLVLIPFELTYQGDSKLVIDIQHKKHIGLKYNKDVNVPNKDLEIPNKPNEPQNEPNEDFVNEEPIFNKDAESLVDSSRDLTKDAKGKEIVLDSNNNLTGYMDLSQKLANLINENNPTLNMEAGTYKVKLIPFTFKGPDGSEVQLYIAKRSRVIEDSYGDNKIKRSVSDCFVVAPNGTIVDIVLGLSDVTLRDVKNMINEALSAKGMDYINGFLNTNRNPLSKLAADKGAKKSLTPEIEPINDNSSSDSDENKAANTMGTIAASQKHDNEYNNDSLDDDEDSLDDDYPLSRKVDTTTNEDYKVWNEEEELAWLGEVLPQLNDKERLQFKEGLIEVAKAGGYAWGQFSNGIMTLSNIAAEGTLYHEAFHAVFHLMLDTNDQNALLQEYAAKNPKLSDTVELEEALAEDFREFVMQGGKDTRGLGRKIIDFFKSLFIKTKLFKSFRPSSIYYFNKINKGGFANKVLKAKNNNTKNNQKAFGLELYNKIQKLMRQLYPEIELNFTDEINPEDIKLGIEEYKALHPEVETLARQMSLEEAMEVLKNSNRKSLEFQLSKGDRKQYERRLTNIRETGVDLETNEFVPTLIKEDIALFKYLDTIQEKKHQNVVFNWYYDGIINIFEDKYKVDRAIELAKKFNLNLKEFSSPMQVVNEYGDKEVTGDGSEWFKLYDNNTEHLSNKREEDGVIVYDVTDSEDTAKFISENIISKFFDTTPWCIFQFNNQRKWIGNSYWNHYNALPRKIAFDKKTGRPVAMFATSDKPTWWDTNDRPNSSLEAAANSISSQEELKKLGFTPYTGYSGNYSKGSEIEGDFYIYKVLRNNNTKDSDIRLTVKEHRSGRKLRRRTEYSKKGKLSVTTHFNEKESINKITIDYDGKVNFEHINIDDVIKILDYTYSNFNSSTVALFIREFLAKYEALLGNISELNQRKLLMQENYNKIRRILNDFDTIFEDSNLLREFNSERHPFIRRVVWEIKDGTLNQYLAQTKFKSLAQLKGLVKSILLKDAYELISRNNNSINQIFNGIRIWKNELNALYTLLMEYSNGSLNSKELKNKLSSTRSETPNQLEDDLLPFQLDKDRILGVADLEALSVLIDRVHQKQDTLPHEYAHHYINWFRNSKLVQEGINRFGSEESLVQAIGEQVVKQKGRAYHWWQRFTNYILNLFNRDQRLLNSLTHSFLTRANLTLQKSINEELNIDKQNIRNQQNSASDNISIYPKREGFTQEMEDILEKAPRDEQGRLLAPNGKVSNLTERQYAHVRTKAFKEWFGDWINNPAEASKVVDENGEPLVVYHATKAKFNTFDSSYAGTGSGNTQNTSDSFYFGRHKETVLDIFHTKNREEYNSYNVMEVFLNIKNPNNVPLDVFNRTWFDKEAYTKLKTGDGIIAIPSETPEQIYKRKVDEYNKKKKDGRLSMWDRLPESPREFMEEQSDYVYVVFNPNQIKSATDNIGTYSKDNADIRYQKEDNNVNQDGTIKSLESMRITPKIIDYNSLDIRTKLELEQQGFTEKEFNRLSEKEKDAIIECAAF